MRRQNFRGNLFVANLPPEFTDEQLAETFDSYGIVLSAFIARDPQTGNRLRYGFVDIATERAARQAIAAMNGRTVDGHNLDVRLSERPAKKPSRPGAPPRRNPVRAMPRRDAAPEAAEHDFGFAPQPDRQLTFQVERRALPRRLLPH